MPRQSFATHVLLNYQPQLWLAVTIASLVAAAGIGQLNFEVDPQNLFRQNNQEFSAPPHCGGGGGDRGLGAAAWALDPRCANHRGDPRGRRDHAGAEAV